MNKNPNAPDSLRADAETQLNRALPASTPLITAEELLHELRLHQIELEMQNEALRQTQIALEESRDRYVDLYDFAPVGYLTLNQSGKIDNINLTGATLLGEDRNKLKNYFFRNFVAKDELSNWNRHLLSVLANNSPQTIEISLNRKDSTTFHARLECVRLGTIGIEPIVRIALSDITRNHLVDTALSESEARYSSFIEQAADGIFVADSKGRYLDVNSAGCNMLGYSREEVLNRTFVDILSPAEIPKLESQLNLLATEELVVSEWQFMRKDGSTFRKRSFIDATCACA